VFVLIGSLPDQQNPRKSCPSVMKTLQTITPLLIISGACRYEPVCVTGPSVFWFLIPGIALLILGRRKRFCRGFACHHRSPGVQPGEPMSNRQSTHATFLDAILRVGQPIPQHRN